MFMEKHASTTPSLIYIPCDFKCTFIYNLFYFYFIYFILFYFILLCVKHNTFSKTFTHPHLHGIDSVKYINIFMKNTCSK